MKTRIVKGAQGLGVLAIISMLARWLGGMSMGWFDIGQSVVNTALNCFTAVQIIALTAYLIWLFVRSVQLEKAVNPGTVSDYCFVTLAGAALVMGVMFGLLALRIGFEGLAAFSVGFFFSSGISMLGLLGSMKIGYSDL